RVFLYFLEDLFQKLRAHLHRQNAYVDGVVPEYISKEARHHAPEAIIVDGPCSVLSATTATKVFASYQYLTRIYRVVQYKVFFEGIVAVVTPVSKEVVTKPFTLGRFQETGWDYLVCIDIF